MHHHSRKQVKNCDTADEAAIARFVPALSALGAHCRNSTRKPPTSAALLLSIFIVLTSTPYASAQQTSAPAAEDTGGLPQLSDFTPPYTCPWFFGRPQSCSSPINVSVECVDLRTLKIPQELTREVTSTELSNTDAACKLLPQWIEKDPRMHVVPENASEIKLRYKFSANGEYFTGVFVYMNERNFGAIKSEHENLNDKASYFVEQSLLELGKRGYLP